MVGENKMDKIAKIEIAKKGLIYIFILIALIILLSLVSGAFGMSMYFLNTLNTSITMIFLMVIFAVTVKYLGDMAIVSLERD